MTQALSPGTIRIQNSQVRGRAPWRGAGREGDSGRAGLQPLPLHEACLGLTPCDSPPLVSASGGVSLSLSDSLVTAKWQSAETPKEGGKPSPRPSPKQPFLSSLTWGCVVVSASGDWRRHRRPPLQAPGASQQNRPPGPPAEKGEGVLRSDSAGDARVCWDLRAVLPSVPLW